MYGINTNYNYAWSNYNSNSIGAMNFSAMNDAKLAQILAKRNGTTSSSSQKTGGLSSGATQFLKDYQSSMTDMLSKANSLRELNSSGAANDLSVSSSDSDVLDASSYYRLDETASYEVNVSQLATVQENTSAAMMADATASFSGQLEVTMGGKNISINTDSLSGTTNEEKLNALAKEVNRYKMGVTASVVKDGDKVSLKLTGTKTGEDSKFYVGGKFAEDNGVGTITQYAQDAEYSVNGSKFTSSSNSVTIGGYEIRANLKKTGTSQVNVGVDVNKMTDNLQSLINSYNKTLTLLNNNSDRGVGVLKQMKRMILPAAPIKSMAMAGIGINKDGTLSLDTSTFKKAMTEKPALIKDIISGSHGVAEGIYQDAQAGLKASSQSLVGSELKASNSNSSSSTSFVGSSSNAAISDSLRMMSAYSRSGAYNMMNYYTVGSMMNMLI